MQGATQRPMWKSRHGEPERRPGSGPARPEGEDPPEQVDRLARAARAREGPEVAHAAAVLLPREEDAREPVGHRHGDERVRLVVAQPDVELRAMLLDQALLEQERLGLRADEPVASTESTRSTRSAVFRSSARSARA